MFKIAECEKHKDTKRRYFCKESSCWASICPICAEEEHKDHNVIDKIVLQSEIKAENENRVRECTQLSNTLKGILKEFDSFTNRLIRKQQKVSSEEKKLESNLANQIKQMGFNINRQKGHSIKKSSECYKKHRK